MPFDIKIMSKIIKIFLNIIPIFIMIGLIPFIQNDYALTSSYIAIIFVLFLLKREKNEFIIFIFGFLFMTVSEYFFINTGVETFIRQSLLVPVQHLLNNKDINANCIIARLDSRNRSQFFQSLRHFSSQPKDLSTTHL